MKKFLTTGFMLVSIFIAGCSQDANQTSVDGKQILIKDFGPKKTNAGQDFNLQSNGVSALWLTTENATQNTIVKLNNQEIKGVIKSDGSVVTVAVPKDLFAKHGTITIQLKDTKTDLESNQVTFSVD